MTHVCSRLTFGETKICWSNTAHLSYYKPNLPVRPVGVYSKPVWQPEERRKEEGKDGRKREREWGQKSSPHALGLPWVAVHLAARPALSQVSRLFCSWNFLHTLLNSFLNREISLRGIFVDVHSACSLLCFITFSLSVGLLGLSF